eukprot:SAG11_NODE_731_length_7473_cov_5.500949_3_plen_227_part_00
MVFKRAVTKDRLNTHTSLLLVDAVPFAVVRTWRYKPLLDTSSIAWWYDVVFVLLTVLYACGELWEIQHHGRRIARIAAARAAAIVSDQGQQNATAAALSARAAAAAGREADPLAAGYFADRSRAMAISYASHSERSRRYTYACIRWNFVDLGNYALFGTAFAFEIASRAICESAINQVNALDAERSARPTGDDEFFVSPFSTYNSGIISVCDKNWNHKCSHESVFG